MRRRSAAVLAVVVLVVSAFAVGRGSRWIEAQGREGPRTREEPTSTDRVDLPATSDVLVYGEENNTAAAANGFLAVTGSYGVGTSVLYLVDTVNRQLAVYEARGGSRTMRRLALVGARRIDLDLQLEGYNDESEFSYSALRKMIAERDARATGGASGETADKR